MYISIVESNTGILQLYCKAPVTIPILELFREQQLLEQTDAIFCSLLLPGLFIYYNSSMSICVSRESNEHFDGESYISHEYV